MPALNPDSNYPDVHDHHKIHNSSHDHHPLRHKSHQSQNVSSIVSQQKPNDLQVQVVVALVVVIVVIVIIVVVIL